MNPDLNFTQEELETIERFINKTMDSNELEQFEKKLQNNPTFKTQVEDVKSLLLGIEMQSLKEELNSFHDEIYEEKIAIKSPSKVISFPIKKMLAAAVIIIALGSYWFFNGSSNEKLYAKHFIPDPGLPTTMGETSNFAFYDAMVNYKQGDYSTAINKWDLLLKTNPKNDTLQYFLGVAHLANKNEIEAIKFLNDVQQFTNSNFKNEAYFYLGLAYLKVNNIELAKKNLTFSNLNQSTALLSELDD